MTNAQQVSAQHRRPLMRQGVSLYLQMAEHLRHLIRSGQWKTFEKLPSMDVLAANYGVARVTIRQAIKILENEGILESQQGRGTFVKKIPEDSPWLTMQAKWESLLYTLTDHNIEVLHEETRTTCLRDELYADSKMASLYRYQCRLHSRGTVPFGINNMYLDEEIYRRAPELLNTKPVVLEIKSLSPHPLLVAKQTLTIAQADPETAHALGLAAYSPVARVRRTVLDIRNVIIYTCEICYRGDAVKIDVQIDI